MKSIAVDITDIIKGYGPEHKDSADKLLDAISKVPNCSNKYALTRSLLNEYIRDWVVESDDDTFEKLYFDTVKYQ